MSKVWLVAKREFTHNVFRKSFILVLLSVPLIMALNIGIVVFVENLNENDAPLGYVDHSGVLEDPIMLPENSSDDPISIIHFQSEDEARAALESEEIQAYYVLGTDYQDTKAAELVYLEEPGRNATRQFSDFLKLNLLTDLPAEISNRVSRGDDVVIRSPDIDSGEGREYPSGAPPFGVILPLILCIAFIFLLMITSGFIMEGVVQERENRTMEVLVTSVTPQQMVSGKVLGIVGISFTQLVFWIIIGIVAVVLGAQVFDIEWLQNTSLDWQGILMITLIAIPTYILAAALMFTVGSTVTESQEGQAFGPIFLLITLIPTWLIVAIIEDPNGTVPTILSLLPFTSLTTLGLRNMGSAVPMWQVALSFGIQVLFATGAIILAGRAFRLGMLRYGKRLSIREVLRRSERSVGEGRASQGGVA